MIMPVFSNVSMRWVTRIPTIEQLVAATASFTKACGVTRVDLMGHSYGSLVASRFLKQNKSMVASTTLLDPVRDSVA
jgi:pimeloyl-ACP methyl ester carboxylesterase